MIKEIVIATHNKAKINEYRRGLSTLRDLGVSIHTSAELHIEDDPEESGTTFEENALLKARYYAEKTGLPSVSDDGGLTIDALNGAPGVYSRRWLGYEASDDELVEQTLKKLENVPDDQRGAQMKLVTCFYDPEKNITLYGHGQVDGYIARDPSPHIKPGLPYRALLIVSQVGKYYDQLTPEEHELVNHRLQALNELVPQIQNLYK